MLSLLVCILCHNALRIFSEFSFIIKAFRDLLMLLRQCLKNSLWFILVIAGNFSLKVQGSDGFCPIASWKDEKSFSFKHDASGISRKQPLLLKLGSIFLTILNFVFPRVHWTKVQGAVFNIVLRGSQRRNIPSLTNSSLLWVSNLSTGLKIYNNSLVVCLVYYSTWNG